MSASLFYTEISRIPSKNMQLTMDNVNGVDVYIPNSARLLVVFVDSTATRCGVYFVYSSSSGGVATVPILNASNITLTTSTNNLNVKSGAVIQAMSVFALGAASNYTHVAQIKPV